jgi:hypothetical protein
MTGLMTMGSSQYIRRLKPEDLDILLNGEEDERPSRPGSWQNLSIESVA